MSSEHWPKYKVGQLCKSVSITHSFNKERLIFLNTGDIERGKFLHRNYSDVAGMPGQAKKSIKKDDILLSEIRPANGRYAFVDFDAEDYVVSTKLMVVRGDEQILPRYLYHFLTHQNITDWLQHLAESRSGTFPQITFTQVADLDILLPPLVTQKAIVDFIDALDEKIELNWQTNATLEAIAQAIFKEWFVHYNYPGATGELVDSELGLIPARWRVGTLGGIVSVAGGTTPSTKEESYWNGEIHWATPKDLSNLSSPVLLDTNRKITEAGLSKISSGLLPQGTLLLSSRAPIGYLAISEIPVAINQGFIAINAKQTSNLFMLFWLKEHMDRVESRANGSTFLEISKTNFKKILIAIPDSKVTDAFDELANSLYEQIKSNEIESNTLIQVRDILLPRLMHGEIVL
jgi:type I restriction enzyme, S subunit